MGVGYAGTAYEGWQSQRSGKTVQDQLEKALATIADEPISTLCAGRTDAGVHALMQVVHFDTQARREIWSWVRGTNARLPADIAVQWAKVVPPEFHVRSSARSRRYAYVLLQSAVRPSVESGRAGWVFHPLSHDPMREAANTLLGEHDFSSFRASACQARSPVKNLQEISITRRGSGETCYWRFEFEANAFLHHMIRNIVGCLVAIGQGKYPASWMQEVLQARSRDAAAPTFAPDGLYFLGPRYDAHWDIPAQTPAFDWLP